MDRFTRVKLRAFSLAFPRPKVAAYHENSDEFKLATDSHPLTKLRDIETVKHYNDKYTAYKLGLLVKEKADDTAEKPDSGTVL